MMVWVPGAAKTKGSMVTQQRRGGGAPRLVQSVEGSERWAALVEQATRQALQHDRSERWPIAGHVGVHLRFWLPVADATQTHAGDIDKLARNVLDALTKAGAYNDDVQVKWLLAEKFPARVHPGPGLLLHVWELAPVPLDEMAWQSLRHNFPHLTA